MDQPATTYYTCRNNHCPKHRGVFLDGDPEHANCKREKLRFGDEPNPRKWLWIAAPAALVLGALAVAMFVQRPEG